mmetsp:Transcript_6712/g.14671  ORF Transcript_6712/g.14671 Transcript_6712/m.14671 type:complete len:177 (-) Transcript_6712:61-591(-)
MEEASADDDEERLVQQVLEENPPEERGERDEWAAHVGWHRKEDTNRLDSDTDTSAGGVDDAGAGGDAATDDDPLELNADENLLGDRDPRQKVPRENGDPRIDETADFSKGKQRDVTATIPQQLRGTESIRLHDDHYRHGTIGTTRRPLVAVIVSLIIFVVCLNILRRRPKTMKDML